MLWFYLQSAFGKHTWRERVRESSSTHPKTERQLEGKVKKTTDLVAVASFRPTQQSRRHQTHVTDLASATSRSNPPWPSSTSEPSPLDRTQSSLSLPFSLNLTGYDEFFGLVWYYIFVWNMRKCEHQVENVFSIVFSTTQPNTKKYFSSIF